MRDVAAESTPEPQLAEPDADYVGSEEQAAPAALPEAEDTVGVTDPTIANAGLTEINDGEDLANGETKQPEALPVPEAIVADSGAANAVTEASWDNKLSQSITSGPDGFEMVEVPRDPAETENGLDATPAAPTTTQSWAEDVPTEATAAPNSINDGFHEVHHGRGRGRGGHNAEFRGRGRGRGDGASQQQP